VSRLDDHSLSISILAIFLLHSPAFWCVKAPDPSFPRQALGSWGTQEMWALVGDDWPYGQKSCNQEIIRAQAMFSRKFEEANLCNKSLPARVLITSRLRCRQGFPSRNSCPPFVIHLATHYFRGSVVGSLSPSGIFLHTEVSHCL
jgi:hypothetical protein